MSEVTYNNHPLYPFKHANYRDKDNRLAGLHKQNGIIMLLYGGGNFKFNEDSIPAITAELKPFFDEDVLKSMIDFMESDDRQLTLF
jgi:hypothetical protein